MRHLIACLLTLAPLVAHASCETKEYAEYKDQALSEPGRMALAFEYCQAQNGLDTGRKLSELAVQHGALRDAEKASARMKECSAAISKIGNALSGANSSKALGFALGRCHGPYPSQ